MRVLAEFARVFAQIGGQKKTGKTKIHTTSRKTYELTPFQPDLPKGFNSERAGEANGENGATIVGGGGDANALTGHKADKASPQGHSGHLTMYWLCHGTPGAKQAQTNTAETKSIRFNLVPTFPQDSCVQAGFIPYGPVSKENTKV